MKFSYLTIFAVLLMAGCSTEPTNLNGTYKTDINYVVSLYRSNPDVTEDFIEFMNAFSNFAVSLKFEQMPASTVVKIVQNSFWSGRPCVPKGGCKGVIDGLRKDLKENSAKLKLSHEITEILPGYGEESTKKHRFCVGVRRRGREDVNWIGADSIIHNGGHPNLLKSLSDDFEINSEIHQQIANTQAVGGIGFVFL